MQNRETVAGNTSVVVGFLLATLTVPSLADQPGKSPVKVFVLVGQSNMMGAGCIDFSERRAASYKDRGFSEDQIRAKEQGTLDHVIRAATDDRYHGLMQADRQWVVRDDVWVFFDRSRLGLKKGDLTVGFGSGDDRIGPEFGFGHVMGDAVENQVLLIKTAWGGKNLAVDFRPPSAGAITFPIDDRTKQRIASGELVVGGYYQKMLAQVREALGNLGAHFPEYDGRGYEIAGFCWHQGWNDGCSEEYSKQYARNLPLFIQDVRKDLGVKDLPFVIATSGFGGVEPRRGVVGRLQQYVQPAQAATADKLDHVVAIDTRPFYRSRDVSPGHGDIEHWFSNGESYFLIGEAMGKAMLRLSDTEKE